MESRAHALAAGIFTVLLSIASAFAVWWFTGNRDQTKEYVLVSSRSVSGLNVQATVRYRGIRAGKVQAIELDPANPRDILVFIRIDDAIPITKATTARIQTQGVTGLTYIQLDENGEGGEPIEAPAGQLARIPMAAQSAESLAEGANEVLIQARDVLGRVGRLLDEQNTQRIGRTLGNLESASAGLSRSAQELPALVAAARQFASEENLRRVQAVLANAEKASADAAPLLAELRGVAVQMQSLARRVDAVAGEAGAELSGSTLPRAGALLQELAGSTRRLNRLLDELERSPQVLIFGRAPARPGPGESGFEAPK
jgi:phospholipid/cholesterol/gamma-HCH transport system substrate-binding protein